MKIIYLPASPKNLGERAEGENFTVLTGITRMEVEEVKGLDGETYRSHYVKIAGGKQYQNKGGAIVKDSAPEAFSFIVQTVAIGDLDELRETLDDLNRFEPICLGVPVDKDVKVLVPQRSKDADREGYGTRTKNAISWADGPGVIMFDIDPPDYLATSPLQVDPADWTPERVVEAMVEAVPALAGQRFLFRPSSSSYVFNRVTDEYHSELKGFRLYTMIDDASETERVGKAIFNHLFLAGYGFIMASARGDAHMRGMIDQAVFSPERLDYACPPTCYKGVHWHGANKARFVGGDRDTLAAADIEDADAKAVQSLRDKLTASDPFAAECASIHEEWLKQQVDNFEAREGRKLNKKERDEAIEKVREQAKGATLYAHYHIEVLDYQNKVAKALGLKRDKDSVVLVTVADILADPQLFHNAVTRDPIEPGYRDGAQTGIILADGEDVVLISQAHGRTAYQLEEEDAFAAFRELMRANDDEEPVAETTPADDDTDEEDDSSLEQSAKSKLSVKKKKTDAKPKISDAEKKRLEAQLQTSQQKKQIAGAAKLRAAEKLMECSGTVDAKKAVNGSSDDDTQVYDGNEYFTIDMLSAYAGNFFDMVMDYNKKFVHVSEGSSDVVALLTGFNSRRRQALPVIKQHRSFLRLMASDNVEWINDKGEVVKVPAAPLWMKDGARNFASGFCFETNPDVSTGSMLNLFTGFPYEPTKKEVDRDGCALLLQHIQENMCDGDDQLAKWLITWMAHIFQRPWEKPGTAVVVRGQQGTGKSIVGDLLRELFGYMGTKIGGGARLDSNFNSFLAGKLFIQVDEMGWAGSNDKADILKDLITSKTQSIENKHRDAIEIKAPCRLFLTSNRDHVVPVEEGDRRYVVLDARDNRVQEEDAHGIMRLVPDLEWFKDVLAEWYHEGGREAFVNLLFNWCPVEDGCFEDGWDALRRAPMTQAKLDQMVHSHSPLDRFMEDLIFNEDGIVHDGNFLLKLSATKKTGRLYVEQGEFNTALAIVAADGRNSYGFKKRPTPRMKREALNRWLLTDLSNDKTRSMFAPTTGHMIKGYLSKAKSIDELQRNAVHVLGCDSSLLPADTAPSAKVLPFPKSKKEA